MLNLYSQTEYPDDHSYKLIQLPADILEYVEGNSGDLTIKSLPDTANLLVLCTGNKTYKLRQMNHSNTVLLSNDMSKNKLAKSLKKTFDTAENTSDAFVSLASLTYEYEPTTSKGYILTDNIPIYDGHKLTNPESSAPISVAELLEISPISAGQFSKEWNRLGGCEVEGRAVVLSRDYISELLSLFLTVLISEEINYREAFSFSLVVRCILAQDQSAVTEEIVHTVLHKFRASQDEDTFRLDNEYISTWFGIQTLFESESKHLSEEDFLIRWKASLPAFYNVPIDIKQLRGNFCRVTADKIQHVNPRVLLAADLGTRIRDLFVVLKEWNYDEFLPFIEEMIPAGKKPDSIILKYAKKRRVGKRSIVSPRI